MPVAARMTSIDGLVTVHDVEAAPDYRYDFALRDHVETMSIAESRYKAQCTDILCGG